MTNTQDYRFKESKVEKGLLDIPEYEWAHGIRYVRISDVPKALQVSLRTFMRGSAVPMVDGEAEDNCMYAWDFKRWVNSLSVGGKSENAEC